MTDYQYSIALFTAGGQPVGQPLASELDFEPAKQWARLNSVRSGINDLRDQPEFEIRPEWSPELNEPVMSAFWVRVLQNGSHGDRTAAANAATEQVESRFPVSFFSGQARRLANVAVKEGLLETGAQYFYRLLAETRPSEPVKKLKFATRRVSTDILTRDGDLPTWIDGARLVGDAHPGDVPVFLPDDVMAHAEELTRLAPGIETGGILVGHLYRDRQHSELFAEVTALIPALDAVSDATSLHFTPEVWSNLKSTLDQRGENEQWLGWFHSHPVKVWCRECSPEKQSVCTMGRDFFSEHDHRLHRSVFGAAYSIAWVVNDTRDGLSHSMFGWREGCLVSRGYYTRNQVRGEINVE